MSEQMVKSLQWGSLVLADSFRYLIAPQLLAIPIPTVPRVACQDCRRVKEETASFEVRCCDIVPVLPNFLVGEILSLQTHPVVTEWITERRGDPFAIWVPPRIAEEHRNARQDGLFGLPCPLLLSGEGRCSIYVQRPALCVSYHCYYPDVLWQEAWACLASTLDLLQDAASRYLVTLFGLDLQKLAVLWGEEAGEIWEGKQQNIAAYQSCWQHWEGREADLYRKCYEIVQTTSPSLGWEVRDLQRQQLWDRLIANAQLSGEQESLLEREFVQRRSLQPKASHPPDWFRARLQEGTLTAEHNPFTIHQQESILLWYLQKLQESPIQQWWRTLWRQKGEVEELRGPGGLSSLQQGVKGDVEKTELEHQQEGQREIGLFVEDKDHNG